MYKIALISLGCSKNTVDSESILGMLDKDNFKIVNNLDDSDLIIINTCGFIEDAKKEAINAIFNALQYNKKLIVVGCLVERYKKDLEKEIPEVDAFVSISEYDKLNVIINSVLNNRKLKNKKFDLYNRTLSTPPYVAYLKISEGCDNFCSFCAIPFIRGRFHSFDQNKLIKYTKEVVKKGVKELYIISQDTVSYGKDFKNKKNINLVTLLKKLEQIEGLKFIKVLYTYPNGITDEYLDLISKSKKIAPYFDIPLQHVSNNILKRMNRYDTKESIVELYKKIKLKIKNPILRTTLMVGFPGETVKDFNELYNFVKDIKFDHLGVFTYSKEENTKSAKIYKDNVSLKTKLNRKDKIMNLQKSISYELNRKLINEKYKAIITTIKQNNEAYVRCSFNSIDEIDGKVIINLKKKHKEGDIINIRITNAFVYDLMGEEI